MISSFILRRPGTILKDILPPKHEYFVFLTMNDIQRNAYKKILNAKIYFASTSEEMGETLGMILVMRKLLNFPGMLLEDETETSKIARGSFPTSDFTQDIWTYSTKLLFVKDMLESIPLNDKTIIVSQFKQTLDLLEIICNFTNRPFLRLDGEVAAM
jgi:SNF2 family DNA or RNA helicase